MIDPKLLKESMSIEAASATALEQASSNVTEHPSNTHRVENYLQLLPADLWINLARYNVAGYWDGLNSSASQKNSNTAKLVRVEGSMGFDSTEDQASTGFAGDINSSAFEYESNSPPITMSTPPYQRLTPPPAITPDAPYRAMTPIEVTPPYTPRMHLNQRLVPPPLNLEEGYHRSVTPTVVTPPDSDLTPPNQRLVPPPPNLGEGYNQLVSPNELTPPYSPRTPQPPRLLTPPPAPDEHQGRNRSPSEASDYIHMHNDWRKHHQNMARTHDEITPPRSARAIANWQINLPPSAFSNMGRQARSAQQSSLAPITAPRLERSLSLPDLTRGHQHRTQMSTLSTEDLTDNAALTQYLSGRASPGSILRSMGVHTLRTYNWRLKMIQRYGLSDNVLRPVAAADTFGWREKMIARYGISDNVLKPPAAGITQSSSERLNPLATPIVRSSSLTNIAMAGNDCAHSNARPTTPDFNRAAASIKRIQLQRKLLLPSYLLEKLTTLSHQLINASPRFQLELVKVTVNQLCIKLQLLFENHFEDMLDDLMRSFNMTHQLSAYREFIDQQYNKILNLNINTKDGILTALEVAASNNDINFFNSLSRQLKEFLLKPYTRLHLDIMTQIYLEECYSSLIYPDALFTHLGKHKLYKAISWMISNAIDINIYALIEGACLIGDVNSLHTICQNLTQHMNDTITIQALREHQENRSHEQSVLYFNGSNKSQNAYGGMNLPMMGYLNEERMIRYFQEIFNESPPAYEQYNRYRKIIIGISFYRFRRIMEPDYDGDASIRSQTLQNAIAYIYSLRLQAGRNAIDFIYSLDSTVYAFGHRLIDILHELTRTCFGETRVRLLAYAIHRYQKLAAAVPLNKVIQRRILSVLIKNSIKDRPSIEDAGILKYFTTLFENYFDRDHRGDDHNMIDIFNIARERESCAGDLFLTSPQLWTWIETKIKSSLIDVQEIKWLGIYLSSEQIRYSVLSGCVRNYFIALCERGAFDLVSAFLDLQRITKKIVIDESVMSSAFVIAIKKDYKIIWQLLLDECYFRNYRDTHRFYFLQKLFNSIECGQTEVTESLSEYGNKIGIVNNLKTLIFEANGHNKYVALIYYLKKCGNQLENLFSLHTGGNSFRGLYPTEIDALLKLHSYLMIKPTIVSFLLYQDVFDAALWADVVNSILAMQHRKYYPEQRPALWRLYLSELLTGGFAVCKSQLDLFIKACINGDESKRGKPGEDEHFTALLTAIAEIAPDKYPDYIRICKAKLETIEKSRITSEKLKLEKSANKNGTSSNELRPPAALGCNGSELRHDITPPESLVRRRSPAQLLGQFSAVARTSGFNQVFAQANSGSDDLAESDREDKRDRLDRAGGRLLGEPR